MPEHLAYDLAGLQLAFSFVRVAVRNVLPNCKTPPICPKEKQAITSRRGESVSFDVERY